MEVKHGRCVLSASRHALSSQVVRIITVRTRLHAEKSGWVCQQADCTLRFARASGRIPETARIDRALLYTDVRGRVFVEVLVGRYPVAA